MARKSDYGYGLYKQQEETMTRLEHLERLVGELTEEKKVLKERIIAQDKELAALKAELAALKETGAQHAEREAALVSENQLLREEVARLKSIINNDSSNTSKPPSTDQQKGKRANTFHSREKSGRKPGGQEGHKGTTLTKAKVEEKIKSGQCKHVVKKIGDPSSKKYVTKYVVDLDINVQITEVRIYADAQGKFHIPPEYYSDVTYGANVKAMTAMLYSEGVMANDRIAAFLNAVSDGGLGLSKGSVYSFCRDLAGAAETSVSHLEEELLNQEVVCTDATTITVGGQQAYIRNFSVGHTVVYHAMKSKSLEALKKIRFLKRFAGTLVHDHETSLYHFGTDHEECNVHILRYLRKNTEETGNTWSGQMSALLCRMNRARKARIAEGGKCFLAEEIASYEGQYQEILARGWEEHRGTKARYAREDESALLNRLEKYSHNHLLFLYDFKVPFDNNMSERDLRKVKNRQKMAGGFRKNSGQGMYCAILTLVETMKRRGMSILDNIKNLFMGAPAIF